MRKFWTFISYIFHPSLMPTLGTFIVLKNDPYLFIPLDIPQPWIVVLSVVFICTFILPSLLSVFLLKVGRVASITHPSDNDRKTLISFTSLCFLFAYYTFHHNMPDAAQSIGRFMLGINISIIATLITSLFTKVSFHSVGAGGILGTVLGLMHYIDFNYLPWLAGGIILAIIVPLARYKLKAHDTFELFIGLLIGIVAQSLVFFPGGTGYELEENPLSVNFHLPPSALPFRIGVILQGMVSVGNGLKPFTTIIPQLYKVGRKIFSPQ